jgi:glycosyltransferase involved in cell wall biosynthesis
MDVPNLRRTIVSLTPLPLSADSRTLKQAISVARFGYRSIVIEGRTSGLAGAGFPIEVLGLFKDRNDESTVQHRTPKPEARPTGFFAAAQRSTLFVRRFWRHCFDLLRIFRFAPKAELYYLHAFYQFPAVFLLCLRYRAKMIYDAHDFYSQIENTDALPRFRRFVVRPLELLLERFCVRFADAVVTVGDGIGDLIKARFGVSAVVLRNVHDHRLSTQPRQTIRDALGLASDAFLVLTIGNWKKGMAIEPSLDALARLPQRTHWAFLGAGYPDLSQTVGARQLAGRVHVLPPVKPSEVVPFSASADAAAVIYYSRSVNYENALPNGFFQSIAAGLPLVFPDLREMRSVAERHEIGAMIDPHEAAQTADALRLLIDDASARDEMRARLQVASQILTWENEEAGLRHLLEALIAGGAPADPHFAPN